MTPPEMLEQAGPVILQILTAIYPVWVKIAPAIGFVGNHPALTTMAFVLGGGTAANIIARALNAIPLGPWFTFLGAAGRAVSDFGNRRYSAPAWAPFEEFLVKWLHGSSDALVGGLQADKAQSPCANVTPEQTMKSPAA